MKQKSIVYQVDAFTNTVFRGNPAGVFVGGKEPSKEWMQNLAMEMNLSETAFVFPSNGTRNIRFFTPESEVKLCGHATLSASHILYETGISKPEEKIVFSSLSGELSARKNGNWITLDFPAFPFQKIDISNDFRKITGLDPVELYETGHGWTLVLLKSEEEVRNIKPNLALMKNSRFGDMIVTAGSANPDFDFCVRCFAPALGIDEDPVTGSAHCALVPFWSERTGKKDFTSHQVSKREGILKVSLKGNRVEISGQAVTVFRAELMG
jgi:PhzF family phenazine biosynthesis protein